MIDLRFDTKTRPSDLMRRAAAEAEVGDDVACEHFTVIALEKRAAELLGKPAAQNERRIRFVTHRDQSHSDIEQVCAALCEILG